MYPLAAILAAVQLKDRGQLHRMYKDLERSPVPGHVVLALMLRRFVHERVYGDGHEGHLRRIQSMGRALQDSGGRLVLALPLALHERPVLYLCVPCVPVFYSTLQCPLA